MRAAVGGRREEHVLVVQAVAAVHPRQHDLIGGARARRRAVGDVDARRVREVVSCAGDAVHLEAALHGIEDAGVRNLEQTTRRAERHPAVLRGRHIDAVLLDLGLSSDQLADERRGFSFDSSGLLDLRFNPDEGEPAQKLLSRLPERELADLIYRFGEERFSRRIATANCSK